MFDDPIDPARLAEFLEDPCHHVVVALERGVVVGLASGVHYVHPDKAEADLFVNEVGVTKSHRRQGVAAALMQALFEVARNVGCKEAWVLTGQENEGVRQFYASLSESLEEQPPAMFTFKLWGPRVLRSPRW